MAEFCNSDTSSLRTATEQSPTSSLLKKASDRVIAGAAKDFSHPKANKKRDSISHHYPEWRAERVFQQAARASWPIV